LQVLQFEKIVTKVGRHWFNRNIKKDLATADIFTKKVGRHLKQCLDIRGGYKANTLRLLKLSVQ